MPGRKADLKKIAAVTVMLLVFVFSLFIFVPRLRPYLPFKLPALPSKTSDTDLDALKSLPYVTWSREKAKANLRGVTKYDQDQAYFGYNLYSDESQNAFLVDMNGKVVHKWHYPPIKGAWEHVELLPNGDLLALCVGRALVKLDKTGKAIWINKMPTHHDIEVLADGSYLVCSWKQVLYNNRQVRFDSVVHIDKDGKRLEDFSTYDNLEKLKKLHYNLPLDLPPESVKKLRLLINKLDALQRRLAFPLRRTVKHLIKRLAGDKQKLRPRSSMFGKYLTPSHPSKRTTRLKTKMLNAINNLAGDNTAYDYYHLNTIEALPDTPLGRKDKRFQAGNYMLCLRNVDLIIILDKDSREIVWSWGRGVVEWPHNPTMLPDGNLQVFDNGVRRGYTRVLEVNPLNGRIVWEYQANPLPSFFTRLRGGDQRLPNGNTLICESDEGRVFEVTPEGEIVWEFMNPEVNRFQQRRVISRMVRFPREQIEKWLELKPPAGKTNGQPTN